VSGARALYCGGVGLWTPGFAGFEAWAAGAPDPAVTTPRAELLPPTLRRRATSLTNMVATAAAQAAAQAGADLARVPLVLGSSIGETSALALLEEFLVGEGMPSPTRFHNSVHNGPIAYVSIATGNRGFSTAIAAGRETSAAALVEAAAFLAEQGGELVVVLADEPPQAPFEPARPYPPLAVALHLSAAPGPATRAALRDLRRAPAGGPRLPAAFADHPCAGGLALAAAVWSGASVQVALGPEGPRGWAVDVAPGTGP
jgi:hypothetical protein